MEWYEFRSDLRIHRETDLHPHVPAERANLFSSTAFQDVEIEYLDLLFGLVRARKPVRLLETGTHMGFSAAALGFAARANALVDHVPKIHTLEISVDHSSQAHDLITQCGLQEYVEVLTGDSLDLIPTLRKHGPFDFVFFDSSRLVRVAEFRLLQRDDLLAPSCVLVFHDTSSRRAQSMAHQTDTQSQYLAGLKAMEMMCKTRIDFELSRGLTLFELQR